MFNALVTVLESVADPSDATTSVFQNTDGSWNIFDGLRTDPTGTPAAFIIPADGPKSKFLTSNMNERGYGFYLFVVMDSMETTYAQSRINMRLITDSILDSIDRSNMLNETADILDASTFKWEETETSSGVNIIAPFELMAVKLIQTQ